MNRNEWRDVIKENCIANGTYRETFGPIIDTLAVILERRDKAEEQFELSGDPVIITSLKTNGSPRQDLHPALKIANELNREALAYWRDLGLTPAGLKKLNAEVVIKPTSGFEALLTKVLDE